MTTKSQSSVPFELVGKDGRLQLEAVGEDRKIIGVTPAVLLTDPLYARNISGALRACAAWGAQQLWWTGERIRAEIEGIRRLPREERMKGYKNVQLLTHDKPLAFFPPGTTPVCVELVPGAVQLHHFEHPENAVYVFGPEDGSVASPYRGLCHHFVVLPTAHCINLSAAVNVVLAHRRFQRIAAGIEVEPDGGWLAEHRGPMISMSEEG